MLELFFVSTGIRVLNPYGRFVIWYFCQVKLGFWYQVTRTGVGSVLLPSIPFLSCSGDTTNIFHQRVG